MKKTTSEWNTIMLIRTVSSMMTKMLLHKNLLSTSLPRLADDPQNAHAKLSRKSRRTQPTGLTVFNQRRQRERAVQSIN